MRTRPLTMMISLSLLALIACAPGGAAPTATIVPLQDSDRVQSAPSGVPGSGSESQVQASPTPRPPTPTPTSTPAATLLPTPSPIPPPESQEGEAASAPRAEVVISALNVREGPGIGYPVVGVALMGEVFDVTGINPAGDWLQVIAADGNPGWVSGKPAYTRVMGSLDGIATVEASPPLMPAAASGTTTGGGSGGKLVFMTTSGGDIYVINADGSGLRHLASGGIDPALSPDGNQVAFTRWEGPQHGAFGSLWVINVDGTGERAILGDVRQPKSPTWSPGGNRIAISMQQGGRLQPEQKCSDSFPTEPVVDREDIRTVVEVEPDGDVKVKFCYTLLPHPYWSLRTVDVVTGMFEDLPHDLFSYAPAWDPNNDWHVVYAGELGLVNLDLNQEKNWALTDDVRDHTPVFSPDGSRIAVSYKQHDHWDIHVMNAGGTGRVRLTETPLRVIVEQQLKGQEPRSWNNVSPTWSPDGSQIAFLSDRSGQWEIWVMSANGGNQRPMFPPGTLTGINFQFNNVDERMISWGR